MATSSKSSSKKLVRNPNTPSLKSQGAGYSTTDRKGNTTFYKSSKDAPGYNDTFQGKGTTSKGNAPISKFDSGGAPVITPNSLAKTNVFTAPTPTITDPGNVATQGNTQIASILSGAGYTQDPKGMIVPPVAGSAEAATIASNNSMAQQLQSLLGLKQEQASAVDTYNALSEKKAVERAQKEKNALAGQLNSITANSQAQQLALEGQGRGQTSSFVGGEQARINREAAIAALPVQAQLSAAEGNLEFAQKQLDTMFQLKMTDSTNKTNFWNGLVDTALNFATTSQANLLTAKLADINTKAQKEQANITYLRQLAAEARDNGNANALTALGGIDTNSPTFEADVAKAAGMIRKPVVSTVTKRDTQVVDGKLIDTQTGEVINDFAGANTQQQEQLSETLTLARELLSDETAGKSGAIGFGFQKFVPFGQTLGLQGDRTSFENKVNTLKANLTLDNLKLLKGPMSDKDLAFLQAIGSSITPSMSEKSFNSEVTRVINKLEEKVAPASLLGAKVIVAPDGQEIEIID